MRKSFSFVNHYFFTLSFLILIIKPASGQKWGGWVFGQAGPTYQRIKVSGTAQTTTTVFSPTTIPYDTTRTGPIDEERGLLGLYFNICPTIYRFNDNISIGNMTGFNLGGWGNNYGVYLYGSIPSYITFRIGANATKQSKNKFGIAAGFGYQYNLNYLSSENALFGAIFPNYSASYFLPAYMIELNLHKGRGGYTSLRFNGTLGKFHDTKGELEKQDEYWKNPFGLSLIFNFGKN